MSLDYAPYENTETEIFQHILKIGLHLKQNFGTFITKDKNGENIPQLEITEVALAHCNRANNTYQKDRRVLYAFIYS